MGNGHLNIGINQGDAGVLNPVPAIQQFGAIVAQQRAEKAARDKELAAQMASLKSDAIRDADKADYLEKYNDWKNTAINANNLPKNSRQRLDAIATAQQKYNDLGEFVGKSKGEKAHENSLGNMWLSNQHLFDDASHQKFIKSLKSPMSSKDYVPSDQYGNFERYVDPQKINDLLNKGKETALKDVIPERIQTPNVTQGDKKGVLIQNKKTIPYEKVAENYLHLAAMNPEFKKFLHDTYPSIQGESDLATTAARIHQLAIDRNELKGWTHAENAQFKANTAPDKYYEHRAYAAAHPLPNTALANQPTPAQIMIGGNPNVGSTGMLQGDEAAVNRFIKLAPTAQYGGQKPQFSTDATTGEHIFSFPAKVTKDQKAIDDNRMLKSEYAKRPEKKGGILGIGGTPIPFEQSKMAADLKPELKEKSPAVTYKLNPQDGQDYFGQVEKIANEQGIKLPSYNQTLGVKGHGIIQTATKGAKTKTVKLKIPDTKLY